MPIYKLDQIGDVTKAFLEDPSYDVWSDAARSYQNHKGCKELFGRKKPGKASYSFTWNFKTDSSNNTQLDGLHSRDTLNRVDLMEKASGRYSWQKTHFLFDRREPAFMSNNATEIYDYLKVQRSDMYDGFFKKNEDYIWTLPATPNDGTAGEVAPYGIPYFITTTSAATTFGFNGGEATGYSLTAGVEKDANEQLRNGNGLYSSEDTMEEQLNDALDLCSFEAPYEGSAKLGEQVVGSSYSLMSSRKPYKMYQSLLYGLNDNIGSDAGKYRGKVRDHGGSLMYRGVPWNWISALSKVSGTARDLNEPIYGLNWDTWEVRAYDDLFMKLDEVQRVDGSHNEMVAWMDTGYQIVCRSFRDNFVLTASVASAT